MRDWLFYITAKVVAFFIRLLPLGLALGVGKKIGSLNYYLNKKRCSIAYSNLKFAFCREKTPQEIARIAKKTFQNLGQVLIEVLRFPKVDERYIDKYITIEGIEEIDKALAKQKGVIVLSAHFGNWELSAAVSAIKGYPTKVLTKKQKYNRLNSLLNSYREKKGYKVVPKGMTVREIIRSLRNNEIVGILGDQGGKRSGIFVDFFGRLASAPSGAISLALNTGCEIIPFFMIRQKGGRHNLKIEPPLELVRSADRSKDIEIGIQRFNALLESYVRQYPDQWLWLYSRWKHGPENSVLMITEEGEAPPDQSEVLDMIRQQGIYRFKKGDISFEVVNVKFKSKLSRQLLRFFSLFASSDCQGCMRCLRFCLTSESYQKLMERAADLIIYSEPSLSSVALFVSKELRSDFKLCTSSDKEFGDSRDI